MKLYTVGVRTLLSGNILVLLVVLMLYMFLPIFQFLELKSIDTRFQVRNALGMNPKYSNALLHINLDNYSKQASSINRWPLKHYADLVGRISMGNAKVIACDVMFGTEEAGIGALVNAVITAANVVSPLVLDFSRSASSFPTSKSLGLQFNPPVKRGLIPPASHVLVAPILEIAEQSELGFVNIDSDRDGVVRRVQLVADLHGTLVPSFFLQAVADYLDYDIENIAPVDGSSLVLKDFPVGVNGTLRDVEVPLDGNGNLVVNLAGKFNGENYPQSYSAWDLLQAEGQPDFAGKLVFLADTSVERASAGDFSPVPLESVFPRSYVLSNAASSILNGEFIQPVSNVFSTAFTLVATALLSMVLVVVCWKTSTMVLSLTALGVIVLYLAGILCFFLFGGWLLPTVTVPISLVAVFLFSSGWQRREHQEFALVDGLTGLYNRRWLDQFLLRQMSRARVSGESLSIAMIDIDHFKNFNDTYGHQVGDFVLVSIADCLRNSLRPTDLTARYGGEEFTVILPQTSGENAMIAAERVRESVSSLNLVTPGGLELPPLTISIGVSELTASESMEQLIEAADRALYTAKESGRNRVHNATV